MAILTVGSHSTYPTIADAMDDANAFDTISLESGYSDESAVITADSLTITGTASSLNINLELANGIGSVTLQGAAPINIVDNSGNNTITGNAGANVIEVSAGVDVVHGGAGDDRLVVDYSTDASAIIGTATHITDSGTHAVTFDGIENFTITTGSGNDTITSNDGTNFINTNDGDDTVTSGDGHNQIRAGDGNDTVTTGDGGSSIWGESGNDTITSGNGSDALSGGVGDDTLSGGGGNDRIYGADGNDIISGGAGNDLIVGGAGINTLHGGAGTDTVDYFTSTMGVNVHLQSADAQAVNTIETDSFGSIENIVGSKFDDVLGGTSSANTIRGGLGADQINGGLGADIFVYGQAQESTGPSYDTIKGFDALSDKFDVIGTITGVNTALTTGGLSSTGFNANLVTDVNASHLAAHHAVEFTPDSGTLAGDHFLIVDMNGVAGYQANADLVIALDTPLNMSHLSAESFI